LSPIALPKCFKQCDEQLGVFALGVDPDHSAGLGMQRPGEIPFLIGAGSGDSDLLALGAPEKTNARISASSTKKRATPGRRSLSACSIAASRSLLRGSRRHKVGRARRQP
jgi:hypothetical protein